MSRYLLLARHYPAAIITCIALVALLLLARAAARSTAVGADLPSTIDEGPSPANLIRNAPAMMNLTTPTSTTAATPAHPAGADHPHRPIVIAHRGASGYLPEHTLAGYALGFGLGADWLEPDVVLTRDGELICLHDIHLERTTNVETAFPDRARADGRWYAIDFSLDEIRQLQIDGPAEHGDGSGPLPIGGGFHIPTLREMLELVHLLKARTGRRAGVIIEPKQPAFHRHENQPIEPVLLHLLAEFHLTRREDPVVVQSFDAASLRFMREDLKTDLSLCFLCGNMEDVDRIGGLEAIAPIVQSIGPNRKLAEENDAFILREAKRLNLETYPWTFGRDLDLMRRFFHVHKVTGLFTDYPDAGVIAANQAP